MCLIDHPFYIALKLQVNDSLASFLMGEKRESYDKSRVLHGITKSNSTSPRIIQVTCTVLTICFCSNFLNTNKKETTVALFFKIQ